MDGLIDAIEAFRRMDWDKERIRRHALEFDDAVFTKDMTRIVRESWDEFNGDLPSPAAAELQGVTP